MSQFRSIGRQGNYANAGKSAADDALRSFVAARKHSVDYGDLAQKAATIRSNEKVSAIQAEAQVERASINAQAELKATKIKTEGKQDLKKGKRFAGVVGAAGQLTATGISGLGEEKFKPRDSSELITSLTEQEEKLRAKATSIREGIKNGTSNSSTASDNQDGGSTPAGKAVSATSDSGPTSMRLMADLTKNGYSDVQAAAIVGNAQYESANFTAHEEFEPNAYGTKGAGFFQWTNAGGSNRRDSFEGFAAQQGLDPTSYEANTGYMMHELKGGAGNHWTGGMSDESFRQIGDLNTAVTTFQDTYLRPAKETANTGQRIKNAQDILDMWKNQNS